MKVELERTWKLWAWALDGYSTSGLGYDQVALNLCPGLSFIRAFDGYKKDISSLFGLGKKPLSGFKLMYYGLSFGPRPTGSGLGPFQL